MSLAGMTNGQVLFFVKEEARGWKLRVEGFEYFLTVTFIWRLEMVKIS